MIAALMRSGRLRRDDGPAQGMIVGPTTLRLSRDSPLGKSQDHFPWDGEHYARVEAMDDGAKVSLRSGPRQ